MVDKDILCEYDLDQELIYKLGFDEIQDILPLRKIYIIINDGNKKIIKMVNSKSERLEFIDKALSQISVEFPKILTYCKNRENKLYTDWNGKRYIVLEMLDGREVSFTNPLEVEACSLLLANYHEKAGIEKIALDEEEVEKNTAGDFIDTIKENLNELVRIEEMIKNYKYKNEFDKLILENIEYYKQQVTNSIQLLLVSDYRELKKEKNNLVLCHNDLAHHNFIVDKEEVKLIDFDYCEFDISVVDLCNFMIKAIKNLNYDMDIAQSIIGNYSSVRAISNKEIKILYSLINYPRDFVTITIDYYNKRKKWSEEVFLGRLNTKLLNEEYRTRFIKEFINKIE